MLTIKAEVKAEVLSSADTVVETGDGAVLVHGQVVLETEERADLFHPDLDNHIKVIKCNFCPASQQIGSLEEWRQHCQARHPTEAWWRAQLIPLTSSPSGPFTCALCNLSFPDLQQLEEHRESVVRTVRLVCPQCGGQFGDLENHLQTKHESVVSCTLCGEMVRGGALAQHYKVRHQGFPSVLAESVASCAGDGCHLHWQETVLATQYRFSAEEVKPAPEQEEAEPQAYIVPPPPPLKPQPGLVRLAPKKFLFVHPSKVNQPETGLDRS